MEVNWSAGQFISYHFDMRLTWIDFKTYRKITYARNGLPARLRVVIL